MIDDGRPSSSAGRNCRARSRRTSSAGHEGKSWLYTSDAEVETSDSSLTFGPDFVGGRAPAHGEHLLHAAEVDVAAGQWLLTNDRFLGTRVVGHWLGDETPDLRRLADRVLALGPEHYRFYAHADGGWTGDGWTSPVRRSTTQALSSAASARVESELRSAAAAAVDRRRRPVVLLSGGVDSGLAAAFAFAANENTVALTLTTPWGGEAERAAESAAHIGLPLETVALGEDELLAGVGAAQAWLQDGNPETTLIQLLVTCAQDLAGQMGDLLITGMGSDLLNAPGDTGMSAAPSSAGGGGTPVLARRVRETSSSGLFQTGSHHPENRRRRVPIVYPYWQPRTVDAQLDVADSDKAGAGTEKYYLRAIAEKHLPKHIAWGEKLAIHHGGGLSDGLTRLLRQLHPGQDPFGAVWERTLSHHVSL